MLSRGYGREREQTHGPARTRAPAGGEAAAGGCPSKGRSSLNTAGDAGPGPPACVDFLRTGCPRQPTCSPQVGVSGAGEGHSSRPSDAAAPAEFAASRGQRCALQVPAGDGRWLKSSGGWGGPEWPLSAPSQCCDVRGAGRDSSTFLNACSWGDSKSPFPERGLRSAPAVQRPQGLHGHVLPPGREHRPQFRGDLGRH